MAAVFAVQAAVLIAECPSAWQPQQHLHKIVTVTAIAATKTTTAAMTTTKQQQQQQ